MAQVGGRGGTRPGPTTLNSTDRLAQGMQELLMARPAIMLFGVALISGDEDPLVVRAQQMGAAH